MTSTVMDTSIAHCPGSGVKVYVVVDELSGAGDHVPIIEFVLATGKFKASPEQMAGIWVNVGVMAFPTMSCIDS